MLRLPVKILIQEAYSDMQFMMPQRDMLSSGTDNGTAGATGCCYYSQPYESLNEFREML